MRNLFLIVLTMGMVFASCSNIEQFREPITALVSNWEAATGKATQFNDDLAAGQKMLQGMIQEIAGSQEMFAAADPATKTKVDSLHKDLENQGQSFQSMQSTVAAFLAQWEENGKKVTELKDGLAAGKLPTDVATLIPSLDSLVSSATTSLGEWQTGLDNLKNASSATFSQFSEVKKMAEEAMATKK